MSGAKDLQPLATTTRRGVSVTRRSAPEPAPQPKATHLVGRFGSFLLCSPKRFERPHRRTLDLIADSLEKDPRVVSVQRPDGIEDDWCGQTTFFPAPATPESVISADDSLKVLSFNRPLNFSVNVPEKNQPKMRETDAVPTNYQVFWDGLLILVTWRVPSSKALPLSGGHVVSEILNEALQRLNLRLYVQGCNPACTHEFAHAYIRFLPQKERHGVAYEDCPNWDKEVHALTPLRSDDEIATLVFRDILATAEGFTQLKNYGRRILETEAVGRRTLDALMGINYERSEIATIPRKERVKAHWEMRGWFRQARLLISQVWIILANIEGLRREWERFKLEFERRAKQHGRQLLFARDYTDEVARVQALDLGLMRDGVQELAERLDSRALLRVTAVAAIAGAIAGGVVGGVAGNLF